MTKTEQTAVEKHLSDPYNRIKYCYEFLKESDDQMYRASMRRIYYFLSTNIDCECHY